MLTARWSLSTVLYQILLRTMKITIVPLAICFVFGWLAGWFGHWLWVDIGKRERAQREREAKPRS